VWAGSPVRGRARASAGRSTLQKAPAKLAQLASTAIVYEWEIDANGKATGVFWSWN
jgi:hypothetical protein